LRVRREERVSGYSFVAPALVFMAVLMIYPLFRSITLSLTNQQIGVPGSFVGLQNYAQLLRQGVFQQALINSAIYAGGALTLKMVLGMGLALLLNRMRWGQSFFRALALFPWVIPISMSVLVWQWMYNPSYSVLNWLLARVGIPPVQWLGSSFWAHVAVITVNVWRGTPFFAIALAAGLNTVPKELYEVASLDGARPWRVFFRITLPLIMPIFVIVLMYSTVQTVSDFEIVFILTRGGPGNSTYLLGPLAFQIGLAGTDLSKGAAISLFIFPVLFVAAFFALRTVTSDEGY
jgi:multiple sugar transport system permease protein